MNLDIHIIPFIKFISKKVRDINVRWKTIKFLEEDVWDNQCDLGFYDEFLDIMPKTQSMKQSK